MIWIWLGIILFLTLIEVSTVNLVTVWYIASAIVAMILSIFVDSYFVQFLVFVVLGTILLLTTRDIGMEAIVTQEINKNKPGEVFVDGKRWTAISEKKIKVDSTVKVLEINGVKLKVEEVKD